MRHEILKKTLLYRLIAYTVTVLINLGSPLGTFLSIIFATISELTSLIIYYVYEYYWRKLTIRRNLKKGMNLFFGTMEDRESKDPHGWYNVIEDLGEGKIVIEVI